LQTGGEYQDSIGDRAAGGIRRELRLMSTGSGTSSTANLTGSLVRVVSRVTSASSTSG
jgi:hypothetical protein